MKNKRGFTLIELLAVIVVLAIVMTIAVSTILPYMNKAKNESFEINAKSFKTASKNFINLASLGEIQIPNEPINSYNNSHDIDDIEDWYKVGNTVVVSLRKMVELGLIEANIDQYTASSSTTHPKKDGYAVFETVNGKLQIQYYVYIEEDKIKAYDGSGNETSLDSILGSTINTPQEFYDTVQTKSANYNYGCPDINKFVAESFESNVEEFLEIAKNLPTLVSNGGIAIPNTIQDINSLVNPSTGKIDVSTIRDWCKFDISNMSEICYSAKKLSELGIFNKNVSKYTPVDDNSYSERDGMIMWLIDNESNTIQMTVVMYREGDELKMFQISGDEVIDATTQLSQLGVTSANNYYQFYSVHGNFANYNYGCIPTS